MAPGVSSMFMTHSQTHSSAILRMRYSTPRQRFAGADTENFPSLFQANIEDTDEEESFPGWCNDASEFTDYQAYAGSFYAGPGVMDSSKRSADNDELKRGGGVNDGSVVFAWVSDREDTIDVDVSIVMPSDLVDVRLLVTTKGVSSETVRGSDAKLS